MKERHLAMMRYIDARKRFTARELAERFGVSLRTIQRDLDRLQQLGYPLYSEAGAAGGYRVLPNRLLPPLALTEHEAFGLFLLLKWLERVPDFPYGSIRGHLAEQYFATLPEDVRERIDAIGNHIAVLDGSAQLPSPHTTMILNAATEKRGMRITYHGKQGNKTFTVFPIGLYYERGFWYMPAYSEERALLYRVDRIRQASVLDERRAELPSLIDWMSEPDSRKTVRVSLRFTQEGKRAAAGDPHFRSMRGLQWEGDVPEQELPFLSRRLYGYGAEVKVESPEALRDMVIRQAEECLRQYR